MADDFEQFDTWQSLWDQARQTQAFQPQQKPQVVEDEFDSADSAQDAYWNYLSSGDEEELLQEGKTTNPVYPDSVGKDQDRPKAAWVDASLVEEIQDLKKRLYELEVKLNIEDAGGGKWVEKAHHSNDKKLFKQISEIKKQIDELSNSLGTKDEPHISQWNATTK